MNNNRINITKKLRFEVFKRDSFTCQYCGRKSPDVVLNVDHINPVKRGGKNDILNLITSCFDCNSGKKDRILDDNSVIKKQQQQLEKLNEEVIMNGFKYIYKGVNKIRMSGYWVQKIVFKGLENVPDKHFDLPVGNMAIKDLKIEIETQ